MAIPANAKILYGVLSSLMRREGYCWPSNAQLAEAMHCSEDTASRLVTVLGEAGHIKIVIEPNRTTGGKIRRIYPALPEPVLAETDEGYSAILPSTYSAKKPRVIGKNAESLYIDGYKKDNKKKKEKEKPTASAVAASLLESCEGYGHEVTEAMQQFLTMRLEIKKPLKSKQAATLLWNKLTTLSEEDPAHMTALLRTAAERQWLSLYQLKEDELRALRREAPEQGGGKVDLSGLRFV